MAYQPIENYGVIGNMQSIALVGTNGSIDFLCYPEFDSPTVFAALLDDQKGGRFEIRPQLSNLRVRQLYLPDTNILLTRFLAEQGVAELTDYMPIEQDGEQPNEIVRTVSVIRGNVNFRMCCQPRFNYAACKHEIQVSNEYATFFAEGNACPPLSLYSTVRLINRWVEHSPRERHVKRWFRVSAGRVRPRRRRAASCATRLRRSAAAGRPP